MPIPDAPSTTLATTGESAASTAACLALAASGALAPGALDQTLVRAGLVPDARGWSRLGSTLLPALATLLAIAGVICVVAANWQEIGRFGRFGLGLAVLTVVVAAALVAGLQGQVGPWLLVLAIGLIGPLLALHGQTYQTGADVYRLMFIWAGLALPWMLAARLAAAWALVLVIVQAACASWLGARGGWWFWPGAGHWPTWLVAAVGQSLLLAGWTLARRRIDWLAPRWPLWLLAAGLLLILSMAVHVALIQSLLPWRWLAVAAWLLALLALGWAFGRPAPDLTILAMVMVSVVWVACAAAFQASHSIPVAAIVTLAATGAGTWWLRGYQLGLAGATASEGDR